jgi:hypothetical protein
MTLYSLVLFLHVGAALALAAALSIDALIMVQLRRAATPSAAHPWLNLWAAVPRVAGSSGLVLLLSGGYLTDRMSAWSLAWPTVALAALILIGILGAITGKRMSALRRICAIEKTNESECVSRLQDPILKVSLSLRIVLLFAAVLLMNTKPGLGESFGIVTGSVILGLISAFLIPNRGFALSTPRADEASR